MGLGQNIALLRKNVGLTQEKLAERCAVSRQAVTKWESGDSEPSIEKLVTLSDIFDVSIDEIVKSDRVDSLKLNKNEDSIDYESIARYVYAMQQKKRGKIGIDYECARKSISMLNKNRSLDWNKGKTYKNSLLKFLYESISSEFLGEDGKVKEKYLLSNTNKEKRKVAVVHIDGFFIGQQNPFDDYIEGKCEIDEVFACIENELNDQRNLELQNELLDKKSDTEYVKLSWRYQAILYNQNIRFEQYADYDDGDFDEFFEGLYSRLNKQGTDTFLGKFMLFLLKEIDDSCRKRDVKRIKELYDDWGIFEDYIWYKA